MGSHHTDDGRVEVAAVVEGEDRAVPAGDMFQASDLDARVQHRPDTGEGPEPLLELPPGHLHDAFGDVEVTDRPAPRPGQCGEAGVGVDGRGAAHGREQRSGEEVVGVDVSRVGRDAGRAQPRRARVGLGSSPAKRAQDRGEQSPALGPGRRHDVLGTEDPAEGLGDGRRRRADQEESLTGGPVVVEQRAQVGRHVVNHRLGCNRGCLPHGGVWPSAAGLHGEQGQLHRQRRRGRRLHCRSQRPGRHGDARTVQGVAQYPPRATGEQRPVDVHDGRCSRHRLTLRQAGRLALGRRRYGDAMADQPVQGVTFQRRMSDFEALMWNVEKDPWLNPSGGVIVVCDRPPDVEDFRRRIAHAVAEIPRLRERVVPGVGRLSPPSWAPDPEFDLDNPLRHVALPAPGTLRQLYDLAARLMQDPFDRTRPLWLFVIVDGLEGGRGAMFAKLHHTIADGYAALRLAELYLTLERDAPPPPDVDIDRVVTESVDEAPAVARSGGGLGELGASAVETAGHLWRRQLGRARRAAGEIVLWGADPRRPVDLAARAVATIGQVRSQVGSSGGLPEGSPLWRGRSRHRHFDVVRGPLESMRGSAKGLGGSVNDAFVTGAVLGAVLYHERRETPLDALNISFVVSTRATGGADTNAFVPTRVQVPAGPMTVEERFAAIRARLAVGREGARTGGGMGGGAGVGHPLPTSPLPRVGPAPTANMDFATSNMRGAPVPTYVSGARILWTGTLGPVAGTAFNLTAMSYDGSFDMGLHVDPVAVDDCDDLRRCITAGFQELLAAGGQT